jgi:hypothetical protein
MPDHDAVQKKAGNMERPHPSEDKIKTGVASSTPKELTKEEQMALYEKELKENDWGHQPC